MRKSLPSIITLVSIIVLWEVAVIIFDIPSYLLPRPSAIASTIGENASRLSLHALVTLREILLGFAMAVTVGLALAVVIVYSPRLEAAIFPLLVGSQTVPKIAIAPLFIVWFGFGILPKVLIGFLIAFFPVVISGVVGLRSAPPELLQLLRSMGALQGEQFRRVRFPAALPSIFGGLKIAITSAVIGAIVGEFIGSNAGLGNLMLRSTGTLNIEMVFAALTVLTVMGLLLFWVVTLSERLLAPWNARYREASQADTSLEASRGGG